MKHISNTYFLIFFSMLLIFFYGNLPSSQANILSNSGDSLQVKDILILGNKKTKEHVILREMTFEKGDYILSGNIDTLIQINRNQILNLQLFLEVDVVYRRVSKQDISFVIVLKERWYTIPSLFLELADRNLNEWWYLYDHKLNRVEYGLMLTQNNCWGKNEQFSVLFQGGFSQQLYASYKIPYFAKKKKLGLLIIAQYLRNREFAFTTDQKNHLTYFRLDDFIRRRMKFNAELSFRNKIYLTQFLDLSFNLDEVADTFATLNPLYLANNKQLQRYFALNYVMELNRTDIHYYPSKGYYAKLELSKQGLGVYQDVNYFSLSGQFSFYKPIKKSLNWSSQLALKYSHSKEQTFLLAPNLGYEGVYARTFEYYVIKGQAYFLNRNELKYQVFDKSFYLKFIRLPKFNKIPVVMYVKAFADDAYVYDKSHFVSYKLQNKWLLSGGLGFDLVSYYDLVFRFEYGWNNLGEQGFFIHVNKAI
jgi:outer membrane protein assembly factor BamA